MKIEETVDVRKIDVIIEVENLNKLVNEKNMSFFESFIYLENMKRQGTNVAKIKHEQIKLINQMLYLLPIPLNSETKAKWDNIKAHIL